MPLTQGICTEKPSAVAAAASRSSAVTNLRAAVVRNQYQCSAELESIRCRQSVDSEQPLRPLTGRHWLSVAADRDRMLSLTATLTSSITEDACPTARPLQFTSGTDGGDAQAVIDGRGLHDDATGSCGSPFTNDMVFTFTTRQSASLAAGGLVPGTYWL